MRSVCRRAADRDRPCRLFRLVARGGFSREVGEVAGDTVAPAVVRHPKATSAAPGLTGREGPGGGLAACRWPRRVATDPQPAPMILGIP